ncbi:sensor histidine kinase [Pseudactinotalea suaedae]|uniref:sensor histidine kinase n=1 Tax=Pseudactinotalea suaedae TaxID=1524924 RepID=UPI0012E10069|nr:sensor histidine kinase [Pseudactinotalea suaedae]
MARHEASQPVTRLWLALPYLLAVLAATLTLGSGGNAQAPLVVAICAGVLVWHTWWAVLHPDWLEHRTAPMLVYFVGFLAGSAWLFHLSFGFMLLYLVCFALAFVALPGPWAYLGVALTVAAMLLLPGLVTPSLDNLVLVLAGGVLTVVAGWSIRKVETESAGRRAALADLRRSTAELERAMADNAQLQTELLENAHQQGIARERARIAAEIHDTLAADLAGIVAQLEALVVEMREPDVAARARRSLEVARAALRQARSSVTDMRASIVGDGLADAIERLVRGAAATSTTKVDFAVDGEREPVPDMIADALVRTTGEALRNALRHAGPGSVMVTLSFLGETVSVDVVDDGRGFDPEAHRTGNGLAIIAERMAEVGGRVEVASAPGSGTTLTLIAPLEAEAVP